MPTQKITLPKGMVYSFSATEDHTVVVKVLGSQVEYGEDLNGPAEGFIKREQEHTFTKPGMLRSKSGSEVELVRPDPITVEHEVPNPDVVSSDA